MEKVYRFVFRRTEGIVVDVKAASVEDAAEKLYDRVYDDDGTLHRAFEIGSVDYDDDFIETVDGIEDMPEADVTIE